jgi:hypothetical protein
VRFNGTNETQLNFPSDSFDFVLSLSSIERFGVENYACAQKFKGNWIGSSNQLALPE